MISLFLCLSVCLFVCVCLSLSVSLSVLFLPVSVCIISYCATSSWWCCRLYNVTHKWPVSSSVCLSMSVCLSVRPSVCLCIISGCVTARWRRCRLHNVTHGWPVKVSSSSVASTRSTRCHRQCQATQEAQQVSTLQSQLHTFSFPTAPFSHSHPFGSGSVLVWNRPTPFPG